MYRTVPFLATLLNILLYEYVFIINVETRIQKLCRVYDIVLCNQTPNMTVKNVKFHIRNLPKQNTIFYMEADLLEDFDSDPQLEIKVTKCMNRDSPDTCEHFTTLRPSNPCKFMFLEHMMWSDFVLNIKPRPSCRSKKGHYVLKNATLDPTLFNLFPIEGYNWKLILKFWLKNTPQEYFEICVDSEITHVIIHDE